MKTNFSLKTDGSGLWTNKANSSIKIDEVYLNHVDANDEKLYGELHVVFAPGEWDVEKDDLIYTDELFLAGIQDCLGSKAIGYSEQGMQSETFVSFDVGNDFFTNSPWAARLTGEFVNHIRKLDTAKIVP